MLKSEATELPLKKLKKKMLSTYRSSNPLAIGYTCILMTMYTNTIHNIAKMISYILTLISSMSINKTIHLMQYIYIYTMVLIMMVL